MTDHRAEAAKWLQQAYDDDLSIEDATAQASLLWDIRSALIGIGHALLAVTDAPQTPQEARTATNSPTGQDSASQPPEPDSNVGNGDERQYPPLEPEAAAAIAELHQQLTARGPLTGQHTTGPEAGGPARLKAVENEPIGTVPPVSPGED